MDQSSAAARGRVSLWLCPTELQRQRFLDMNDRVRAARVIQGGAMTAAALFAALWYGWWLVVVALSAVAVLLVLERVYRTAQRPEVASITSIAALEVILLVASAGSGGTHSPLLPFAAIPTIMLAARFRPVVVAWGVAASVVLTFAAVGVATRLSEPPPVPGVVPLAAYLAVLASVVAASTILLQAELKSRDDAVVDQLTGLFNRKALDGRFAEAAAQARMIGTPVSLIILDLDHFKRVNDEQGHDRGDLVLREVAYRMRATLRVLDTVYRFGGEEFVVLLPGHDEAHAFLVAQRLVLDVAAAPLAGLPITVSAGVAGSASQDLAFDTLMKQADQALYAAKHAGRNRAHRACGVPEPVSPRVAGS